MTDIQKRQSLMVLVERIRKFSSFSLLFLFLLFICIFFVLFVSVVSLVYFFVQPTHSSIMLTYAHSQSWTPIPRLLMLAEWLMIK